MQIGPALLALWLASGSGPALAAEPTNGSDPACANFEITTGELFGDLKIYDTTDEGWVWVHRSFPSKPIFREVSGLVVKSHVADNDYPSNHDSHDHNTLVLPDAGQEDILSTGNHPFPNDENPATLPNEPVLEIEWETGILPSEKSGDGANPMFRRQSWPSVGDRFWAEGHWVFDCGHSKNIGGVKHFPSEIHPARAAATMRQVAYPLTSTGATPVPVTLTDIYVHGVAGYVVDQLECGMGVMLSDNANSCATKTTSIAKDYVFDVCLPPKPAGQAILTWLVLPGEGNTLSPQLEVYQVAESGICDNAGAVPLDTNTMLRVKIPLAGSVAQPEDVYARRLIAGWVFPPPTPFRHLTVQLKSMNLHNDQDPPTFNGELSFFWLNLDASPDPWYRLSDFDIPTADDSSVACGDDHLNTLNDYDDDESCGNGELRFSGPRYGFYVRTGAPFRMRTSGFEQDCYDTWFGHHNAFLASFLACHGGDPTEVEDWGENDKIDNLDVIFRAGDTPSYGIGGLRELDAGSDYELRAEIQEIALGDEDSANLGVTMPCTWVGEVLLVGQTLTCTITGTNPFGPGLPRGVVVDFSSTPTSATVNPATFTLRLPNNVGVNNETASGPCEAPSNASVTCKLGTVPGGGTATVPVAVVPTVPGTLVNEVQISATSADSDTTNNSAQATADAYRAVTIVVRPKEGAVKGVKDSGVIPVAILTTPDFDARTIDLATICFGDAEAPAQRDCTEAHARAHFEDVDRDKDIDVLLHYEASQVGIDKGDTQACLIGRLVDGTGIYGCGRLPAL